MSKYKVVGNHTVCGVDPGGTVDIDDDDVAGRLIEGGHLAEKSGPRKASAVDEAGDDASTEEGTV